MLHVYNLMLFCQIFFNYHGSPRGPFKKKKQKKNIQTKILTKPNLTCPEFLAARPKKQTNNKVKTLDGYACDTDIHLHAPLQLPQLGVGGAKAV